MIPEYESLDHAYDEELREVLRSGLNVSPRDLDTHEFTGTAFRISNPRARLIHNRERRWSLHYAIGELIWHLSGSNDLKFISYYSRVWHKFTEDGRTINGSNYGYKIFHSDGNRPSKWDNAKSMLQADPDTRRCVMTLYGDEELSLAKSAKDTPCCNLLQFLVRDNKLCLINYMRSNDLVFGFVYDIFLMTMLQEMMALQLGLQLGWYQHCVGSLHVYRRDEKWAERIASNAGSRGLPMRSMTSLQDLPAMIGYEEQIRNADEIHPDMKFDVAPYWSDMLVALLFHKLRRLRYFDDMIVVAKRLEGTCFESVVNVFL